MGDEQNDSDSKSNRISDLEHESGNADTPEAVAADSRLAEIEKRLEAKTEECKMLHDKYLRLAAEFDNYKRVTQREQREQIKFGNEQLLKELLPTLDNMERAIKAARDNKTAGHDALVQGVELTLKQLVGTLSRFGVQAIETVGQAFDPTAHQAVSHVPSDSVPQDHVIDEFQKGYRLHDRILRAAMVSVSAGPVKTDEQHSTIH
ncbi:MAG: nucleotide exchange factor GrpE [Nitrospira sp.]|nr:nucleotide exchange factor GrpE [Nitrospira sp.]MCP9442621.1 nucleotide exchange factor GrpE [Nitrospira sp.]